MARDQEHKFDSKIDARDDSLVLDPREEEMRAIAVFAGVLMATPSMAEQLVFYTANFPDATSVRLSVQSNSVSRGGDYDFDVAIGLVETDASGAVRYEDTGRHRARVRCSYPAYVSVGARKYPVMMSLSRALHDDWKEYLWMAFCAVPSS
ncbi:hypothetical protein [Mesorhizobium sp.]|uniref:hypothetical protein n=2 Tax=Mesorhizobium sp. TaxID=1871066 RepID=UPI00257AD07B|nr:hypothetical protein [Mesorhizobium sp.]